MKNRGRFMVLAMLVSLSSIAGDNLMVVESNSTRYLTGEEQKSKNPSYDYYRKKDDNVIFLEDPGRVAREKEEAIEKINEVYEHRSGQCVQRFKRGERLARCLERQKQVRDMAIKLLEAK